MQILSELIQWYEVQTQFRWLLERPLKSAGHATVSRRRGVRNVRSAMKLVRAFRIKSRRLFLWLSGFAEVDQAVLLANPILGSNQMYWLAKALCDNTPLQFQSKFGLWTLSLFVSFCRIVRLLGF